MRRWIAIAAAACAAIAAVAWLRCTRTSREPTTPAGDAGSTTSATAPRKRIDPATVVRAAIAGTVTDEAKRPIAGANVCAAGESDDLADELLWAPACATTDATGAYAIEGLLPARYDVSAAARRYVPELRDGIRVAAGARVTGIDLVLRAGGAELAGTVTDATGGPIAQALVVASAVRLGAEPLATAQTDAAGRFAMWVGDGSQRIIALADGYGRGWAAATPPASVHIVLTPESTVSGAVVDATTRRPVAGAQVDLHDAGAADNAPQTAFTDERGEFRFRGLDPGRVDLGARTERAYGRTAGSLLVGLGQHVTGIVIEVSPAFRVEGRVLVGGQPCDRPSVTLEPVGGLLPTVTLRDAGGTLVGEGVLPATYVPGAACGDRDAVKQARLEVAGDVANLVWELPAGGELRGRVLLRGGGPVAGQLVEVHGASSASARTLPDGSFAFTGLAPGEARVTVVRGDVHASDEGEPVTILAGATVERDVIVDAAGAIHGTVVDAEGAPVANETLYARGSPDRIDGSATSDETGAFRIRGLLPGAYFVSAWGETDGAANATVRASTDTTVRITVPSRRGTIRGTVRAAGAPVADAYVIAVAEGGGDARQLAASEVGADPVLTATDGTFAIRKLGAGTYLLRAYRRGGGEAIAERVAIGSTVTLDIAATGSVAGVVRDPDGAPVERLLVKVDGTSRMETFHRTAGRYAIRDLAPGQHALEVYARDARAVRKVTVGPGEAVALDIALERAIAVTGRFVDARTGAAVPHVYFNLQTIEGVTDATGGFAVDGLQPGPHELRWTTRDQLSGVANVVVARASGELGDIAIPRPRAGRGEAGDPGFEIDRELRVLSVQPAAAASGLVSGDTITAIDGADLTGQPWLARIMLRAPPGTEVRVSVARGATMTITLGPPRKM